MESQFSPTIIEGFELAAFRGALADNVECVLDAMQAISDEASGWGDEPTAVFFAGLADAVQAFSRSSRLVSDSADAVRPTNAAMVSPQTRA
jgi:hypothetical protein